jgi:hypothetical protein
MAGSPQLIGPMAVGGNGQIQARSGPPAKRNNLGHSVKMLADKQV